MSIQERRQPPEDATPVTPDIARMFGIIGWILGNLIIIALGALSLIRLVPHTVHERRLEANPGCRIDSCVKGYVTTTRTVGSLPWSLCTAVILVLLLAGFNYWIIHYVHPWAPASTADDTVTPDESEEGDPMTSQDQALMHNQESCDQATAGLRSTDRHRLQFDEPGKEGHVPDFIAQAAPSGDGAGTDAPSPIRNR